MVLLVVARAMLGCGGAQQTASIAKPTPASPAWSPGTVVTLELLLIFMVARPMIAFVRVVGDVSGD